MGPTVGIFKASQNLTHEEFVWYVRRTILTERDFKEDLARDKKKSFYKLWLTTVDNQTCLCIF